MRSLHAGLLVMQGVPIVLGAILAIWIAYYLRVAVTELRAIRQNLEKLNYYFEAPDSHPPTSVEHPPAAQPEIFSAPS
jgi:hypothetical protein